jgi:hypothetical protein
MALDAGAYLNATSSLSAIAMPQEKATANAIPNILKGRII